MFGNGYYFVDVFDLFGATFPLLLIALFECLAVLFYAGKFNNTSASELFTAGIKRCTNFTFIISLSLWSLSLSLSLFIGYGTGTNIYTTMSYGTSHFGPLAGTSHPSYSFWCVVNL